MKTIDALWDICDTLAGHIENPAVAAAFVMAADELNRLGITDWWDSLDYEPAKGNAE